MTMPLDGLDNQDPQEMGDEVRDVDLSTSSGGSGPVGKSLLKSILIIVHVYTSRK